MREGKRGQRPEEEFGDEEFGDEEFGDEGFGDEEFGDEEFRGQFEPPPRKKQDYYQGRQPHNYGYPTVPKVLADALLRLTLRNARQIWIGIEGLCLSSLLIGDTILRLIGRWTAVIVLIPDAMIEASRGRGYNFSDVYASDVQYINMAPNMQRLFGATVLLAWYTYQVVTNKLPNPFQIAADTYAYVNTRLAEAQPWIDSTVKLFEKILP
jgi:hypothetical protein